MAKSSGTSILTGAKNRINQRINAGSLSNGSPFVSINPDEVQKIGQTLEGFVASDPIDFIPAKSTNIVSDNIEIDNTIKTPLKVIYYISAAKSKEIKPITRKFLSLSKGNAEQKNRYKLGLVDLAQGIGGGRIVYDPQKHPISPEIGDYIKFTAVSGDLAFHSTIIEVIKSPEPIIPPQGKAENEDRSQSQSGSSTSSSPTTGTQPKSGVGLVRVPPSSSTAKKGIIYPLRGGIREEILNDRQNYLNVNSDFVIVSLAEFRWILEPEIRKFTTTKFFTTDPFLSPTYKFLEDQWIAEALIHAFAESASKYSGERVLRLKNENWFFAHPYTSAHKVNKCRIKIVHELGTNCNRWDYAPRCKKNHPNEYMPENEVLEKRKRWVAEGKNPNDFKKTDPPFPFPAGLSAGFPYQGFYNMADSAECHYEYHKLFVSGKPEQTDQQYISNFWKYGPYKRKSLYGYKGAIKNMNIDLKKSPVDGEITPVATIESYNELKTDNQLRNYVNKVRTYPKKHNQKK